MPFNDTKTLFGIDLQYIEPLSYKYPRHIHRDECHEPYNTYTLFRWMKSGCLITQIKWTLTLIRLRWVFIYSIVFLKDVSILTKDSIIYSKYCKKKLFTYYLFTINYFILFQFKIYIFLFQYSVWKCDLFMWWQSWSLKNHMNEWCIYYIALYCVLLYTQSTFYDHGGGSLLNHHQCAASNWMIILQKSLYMLTFHWFKTFQLHSLIFLWKEWYIFFQGYFIYRNVKTTTFIYLINIAYLLDKINYLKMNEWITIEL